MLEITHKLQCSANNLVCLLSLLCFQIANYLPSDEDLDYPKKLEQSVSAELGSPSTEQNQDVSGTWYPPLEKTISCLSKLYCSLESAVFTGLAQEVVEFCSLSIQKASKLIGKRSSSMDAQLFLIKHLLILREQIAPFDIEFSVTHKELDFSHLLHKSFPIKILSQFELNLQIASVPNFGSESDGANAQMRDYPMYNILILSRTVKTMVYLYAYHVRAVEVWFSGTQCRED
ncbi:hypothetical protein T459_35521 [Capsicum annuum]|uniref:Conserved oligomeric Golgi complex subunit 3 C-terminal domain-containing protein n=1 Tax=Capsicum annuum TaxID=4072 RepID=A0A2G2XJ28_CAPAN|nr:hypothetical protein T459_35521 [Capsicum annuum]